MKGKVDVRGAEADQAAEGAGTETGTGTGTSSDGTDVVPVGDAATTSASDPQAQSLPATGADELPLFVVGASLMACGLLVGAAAAWFEWSR